jgi:ATP-dependent Clp protease ATP-binding subunit ClpC
MPVIHRFHALLWLDHQKAWTARLLDRDSPVGFGPTPQAAVKQVEDFLSWEYEQDSAQQGPDFHEPELLTVKVPIRPEYSSDTKRFPCDETVTLLVHVVRGQLLHGMLVCSVPVLGLRFYYHEPEGLRNLVVHYVQQRLESVTPGELARFLPPLQARLESFSITLRSRERSCTLSTGVRFGQLPTVAECLSDSGFRKQFSKPYQRDQLVSELTGRLQQARVNVLLVGEPNSGKTTILAEAVRELERRGTGKGQSRRFWLTSGGRLIAGMKYLGQWEERCEEIITELGQVHGVLCVENLLELARLGGTTATDSLAAFFLPYLQRGELRMVAECSPNELNACRRLLPGLVDVFQLLVVPEFTRQEAIEVLESSSAQFASNLKLEIGRGVAATIYYLFQRFQPYGAFPGRATTFTRALFEQLKQKRQDIVEREDVLQMFIRQTGLPELFLRDEMPLNRLEISQCFAKSVIDQPEAIEVATTLVTTFKAGLNDPTRPVAVLLFSGPTGVGKTELAKSLAKFFFGHGEQSDRLIRLDMSEYTGFRAGEKLMVDAEGQPSELVQKVRQQPFVVILFDEIEKASPEVFDVLLGVFDEGRLTDRWGRMTSFRSAVLIMTTNLGAGRRGSFGFGPQAQPDYEQEAASFFRPEFFNRMDRVVTFAPLQRETILAITRKELREISSREGFQKAGIELSWTPAVEDRLVKEGFDERYGARPLQRTLEALVVTPLARFLLANSGLRDALLEVDLDEQGAIVIRQ